MTNKRIARLAAGLCLLAAISLATGCVQRNEGAAAPQASSPDNQSPSAAGSSAATRLFTDATGREVEIPVDPQRIVTTQYLDAMLALGVKPLGAPSHVLNNPYLGELEDGVADLGHPFNIEKVLQLDPDLILSANPDEVEALSKIAPTVVVPWLFGDVYAQLREIARALNKEKEAEDWIAGLEAKAAAGRSALSDKIGKDETVSIFMAYGKDALRVYGARNIGHMIYRSLQLTPPPFIQQKLAEDPEYESFVFENISMEKLPELAGDRIVMLVYDQAAKDEDGMFSRIEQSAVWKNLDAVKNNRVYVIEPDPWFVYAPIAIEKSLDEAVAMFARGE